MLLRETPTVSAHLRQDFFVLPRGNTPEQSAHHALGSGLIFLESFVRRNGDFAFLFVAKARTLHLDLPVGESYATGLRPVPTDVTAELAGGRRAGNLLGGQSQDGLYGLAADGLDHLIHGDSGLGDEFDQREQDLPVGLGELLDAFRRRLCVAVDDMIRFLHGGGVPFQDCFWRFDSNEPAATAAFSLQLNWGHPRVSAAVG